jgi:hypothetical protein
LVEGFVLKIQGGFVIGAIEDSFGVRETDLFYGIPKFFFAWGAARSAARFILSSNALTWEPSPAFVSNFLTSPGFGVIYIC